MQNPNEAIANSLQRIATAYETDLEHRRENRKRIERYWERLSPHMVSFLMNYYFQRDLAPEFYDELGNLQREGVPEPEPPVPPAPTGDPATDTTTQARAPPDPELD